MEIGEKKKQISLFVSPGIVVDLIKKKSKISNTNVEFTVFTSRFRS